MREHTDLGVIVSDYTALRRAGSRLKGLCPFHEEKTPSFTVDAARGLFHCFGCGEGGDVYGFLQRAEALTFPEAVERLARLTGYTLRYTDLSPGQRKAMGRRTRLAEVLAEAAGLYQANLAGPQGAAARAYLRSRGVDRQTAEHFRLGWALDAWDATGQALSAAGYSNSDLEGAGLVSPGPRGLVDRFRGRIVFPIVDPGGRDVVGFGGRTVPGVDLDTAPRGHAPPKYINSPETDVYRKSRVLYGLNWARAEIQRRDAALVVEGYMDVIALHTAGAPHAVATCGTALTAEHLTMLERFARRVVLALDADAAGFAAAERARALAAEAGVDEVGVLELPAGQDPADLAGAGPEVVAEALSATRTAVEFQIAHLLRDADTSTPEGQVAAYRATFDLLARLEDRFLRYSYIRDLVAPVTRLSADHIERELDQATRGAGRSARPGPRQVVRALPGPGDLAAAGPADPQLQLEREVLRAALQHPNLLPPTWEQVEAADFRAPASRLLFEALRGAPRGDLGAVLERLPDDDARSRVRALALSETTVEPEPEKLAQLVARLRAASVERRRDEVKERLTRVNEQTDPAERRRLTAGLYELEVAMRDLREGRDA